MTRPPRKIIPDEQCIVVLDTSPVRDIAYADQIPAWVGRFAEMSKAGYSFSLADGACAELLTQHADGRISDAQLDTIVGAIESFINPAAPVLLGKKDIMGMIGESTDVNWSEAESLTLSKRAWAVLKAAPRTPEKDRISAADELQVDSNDWIGSFARYDAGYASWLERAAKGATTPPLDPYQHPLLEDEFRDLASYSRFQQPDLAERMDLEMRYVWRQWVRTRLYKFPYDPTRGKNRNDGVDLDLYPYLALPAFVVAGDSGFHQRLADIKSPQLDWLQRPHQLADAWARGERPRPAWTGSGTKQATSPHAR